MILQRQHTQITVPFNPSITLIPFSLNTNIILAPKQKQTQNLYGERYRSTEEDTKEIRKKIF
jgi:hypothetical protein